MARCGLFKEWQRILEPLPGLWNCRDISTGQLFVNAATRRYWDIPEKIFSWQLATKWVDIPDLIRFEDAQSRALKFGGIHYCRIGVRSFGNIVVQADHRITSDYCQCGRAVILILVTVPDDPQSLSVSPWEI